jgi:NADH dehydrogenase (ubiquinone) Fe-S protein 2
MQKLNNFQLNFGPQHPAAHGVLRLILTLNNEKILKREPHISLLHRGTEKLIEYKNRLQSIRYFDRLDYVSMLSQEHSFILFLEKIMNIQLNQSLSLLRIILLELTRILNHLMAITTHALDVGAISPFLWGFEEREKIMELFEQCSGARMHMNFFRIGGISKPLPVNFLDNVFRFRITFTSRIDEIQMLLTNNSIWKSRLQNVGVISLQKVMQYSCSGVLTRSIGIPIDMRLQFPYEAYPNFTPFITKNGDCFDRYLIRINEMQQSLYFINYRLENINLQDINNHFKFSLTTMAEVIQHFKYFRVHNLSLKKHEYYVRTESPKGEFGVLRLLNRSNFLFRCKIRSPDYFHLQVLPELLNFSFLRDLVTIIGSQDIVFGSIDR